MEDIERERERERERGKNSSNGTKTKCVYVSLRKKRACEGERRESECVCERIMENGVEREASRIHFSGLATAAAVVVVMGKSIISME